MRELNSIELQAVSGGAVAIRKPVPVCRPIRVICRPERRCGGTPVKAF
jgi:hypothetical protein